MTILFFVTGCRSPIDPPFDVPAASTWNTDWAWNRPPPTLTQEEMQDLPGRVTVGEIIERFGAGKLDPHVFMFMDYGRKGGGLYRFTWVPTHQVPGGVLQSIETEEHLLRLRVLAVLEFLPGNEWDMGMSTYVYPAELLGKRFLGWQGDPTREEMQRSSNKSLERDE